MKMTNVISRDDNSLFCFCAGSLGFKFRARRRRRHRRPPRKLAANWTHKGGEQIRQGSRLVSLGEWILARQMAFAWRCAAAEVAAAAAAHLGIAVLQVAAANASTSALAAVDALTLSESRMFVSSGRRRQCCQQPSSQSAAFATT